MKQRNIKLLRFLMETPQITASTLADKMSVSVRSVKSYVKEINEEYPNAISSSREGYKVDLAIAKEIIDSDNSHIPQTSAERVTYIINELIHHNGSNKIIDMYDLCDEMYISLSTLKTELNKVKRKISKFDLELITKGSMIRIIGLEKNKRKLLSTILYDESNVNFINIQSLQNSFIDIDIEKIKEIIIEIFNKYQYFINDYSLINLILHITIAIDRVRNNYINSEDISFRPAVHFHEYEIALEMTKRIEAEFQVSFNETEIYEICLLIISRTTTVDYKSINENNIEDFIGKDCFELVTELIQGINQYYYININEPEFMVRFALHIRNLLVRAKNNYFSKNPLTEGIKTACPLIYDASVILANELGEKTGIKINDDEIAYIAFHIGSTLEEQKVLAEKISAVLYCPNYYDINLKLVDQLRQHFSNDLLVTNILTDESEIGKISEADLILTTIPLSAAISTPVLNINIFFNEKDRIHLGDKIKELQKKKKKTEFEDYLREMILPTFFEKKERFFDQESCVDYMVNKMVSHGYVDSTFKDEILYRESVSSTAFGNFAVPHAMKMYAKKTGMNIVALDEALEWGTHRVNLVVMMSFNKNERYIFNEIYEPITMILSESKNIEKIVSCNTYDEFIQTMVSLL